MDTSISCSCRCAVDEDEQMIFQLIRALAPDLDDISDNMLMVLISINKHYVSKEKFKSFYHEAVAYLVAHKAVLHQSIASEGAGSNALVGGITSEHEGDLSRSYGSGGSGARGYTDTFDKTLYGLEFKRIRDMCIVPVATRFFG